MDKLVEGICRYCKKECEKERYAHFECSEKRWNELKNKRKEEKQNKTFN